MDGLSKEARAMAVYLWHFGKHQPVELEQRLKTCDLNEFWEERCKAADLPALSEAIERGEEIEFNYRTQGTQLIFSCDEKYPAQMKPMKRKPLILAVLGDANLLSAPQVAIVGSRKTTNEAETLTKIVADEVMRRGFIVTSGGALGIDAMGHRRAMALKKPTIVVTACGPNRVAPVRNNDIFSYARHEGAVVSQFPNDIKGNCLNFPVRNGVIAGLSRAAIIIHCREKSGAIYTADAARKLGREVWVAAMQGFDPLTEGGLGLVKSNQARLLSSLNDLGYLGGGVPIQPMLDFELMKPSAAIMPVLNDTQAALISTIQKSPLTREMLRQSMAFPMDFDESLLELELTGVVRQIGGLYHIM